MRKSLILFLTFLFLCSPFSVMPIALADNTEAVSLKIQSTYELLTALGIMDSGVDLNSKQEITRGEFSEYLAKLLKLRDANISTEQYFTDISNEYSVNALTAMGYFHRDEEGLFYPNRAITFEEATIVLLRVLGYGGYIKALGENSYTYYNLAKKVGLVDNWNINATLSIGNLVEFLYNTLVAEQYDVTKVTGKAVTYSSGQCLLNSFYDVYCVKGVVTANNYLSIYKNLSTVQDGYIRIDANGYACPVKGSYDYIGRSVIAYYHQTKSDSIGEIICIRIDEDEDDSLTISSEDVASVGNNYLKYYATDKKTMSVSLNSPLLIYNGVAMYSAGSSAVEDALRKDRAIIRLSQGDNGSNYTLVFVDAVENGTVQTIDLNNNIAFVDIFGTIKAVPFETTTVPIGDWSKAASYVKAYAIEDGSTVTTANLEIGDLLSCIISEDGSIAKICLCQKRASGTITSITESGDSVSAVINDKEYILDPQFYKQNLDLTVSDSAAFQLDIFGYIASFKGSINHGKSLCAYLFKMGKESGLDGKIKVKIYNQNKEYLILYLAKKVDLDRDKLSADKVYEKLAQGGQLKMQVIRYTVNLNNEINFIDTVTLGANEKLEDTLRVVGNGKQNRTYSKQPNNNFNLGYCIFKASEYDTDNQLGFPMRKETNVMLIPSVIPSEEMGFTVLYGSLLSDTTSYYTELYKYNSDTPFVDFVADFVSEPRSVETDSIPWIVNTISYGINQIGESTTIVECLQDGAAGNTKRFFISANVTLYINETKQTVLGSNIGKYISPGDLIQPNMDSWSGVSYAINVLYDYSEDKVQWGWSNYHLGTYTVPTTYDDYLDYLNNAVKDGHYNYTYDSKTFSEFTNSSGVDKVRMTYGRVEDLYFTFSTFVLTAADLEDEPKVQGVFSVSDGSASTRRYAVFDDTRKNMKAYHGSPKDIVDYTSSGGAKSDKVICVKIGQSPYYFYFYKVK